MKKKHTGPWLKLAADEKSVTWVCAACRQKIEFAKEGFGEPTSTEDAPPRDIEKYLAGTCSDHTERVEMEDGETCPDTGRNLVDIHTVPADVVDALKTTAS